MKSAERIVAVICFTITAVAFMIFMTIDRNSSYNAYAGSPYYIAKDTVTVNSNNILRANTASNYAKWNIDTLTTAAIAETLVMAQPADKLFDNFTFQRFTGQIIISNLSATDTIQIAFPGTDFISLMQGNLVLNPAYHDTIFYKSPGTTLSEFAVLHTTIRTLR